MRIQFYTFIITVLVFAVGCTSSKKVYEGGLDSKFMEAIELDTITIAGKKPFYNSSEKRINDLLHTKLDIRFDWKNQYAIGKANLKFKPHFYPTQTLQLDAKGFTLNEVALVKNGIKNRLDYYYDGKIIIINLDKEYVRDENYEIFIDYIAKPNELPKGGSAAITEDKGLYFIDPLDTIPEKPSQIWTQGETESSSCWFPTIDSPNERTSQEIYLTVQDKYKTISNGKLLSSIKNNDNTRTDYWKQDLPHAPYLFMLAVGEFAEVKDSWNGIETNYYVGKKYEPYAKDIFGNTGEMLEFFGNKFGLAYPWDKYHQVVVEDFVSGAMENTGAVIHYDGLHQTDRELLDDGTMEDIIAHEAAHHWFGDYVTCESWANIPLNESFATFAEIMWERYKYGNAAAEEKIMEDRSNYLAESMQYKAPLIRYFYEEKEDMFDRHSYQKGGQVLLMLEDYLGEEAFYAGLKKYLHDNALKSVEIHNLRLAMEAICGEDLNWFFNQWFLGAGHPQLKVEQFYDAEFGTVTVSVNQTQEEKLFVLPVKINIHQTGNMMEEEILIKKREEVFSFKVDEKPTWLDFDVNNILLAEIDFEQNKDQLLNQFTKSKSMLKRFDALSNLQEQQQDEKVAIIFKNALNDEADYIRQNVINILDYDKYKNKEALKSALINLVNYDKKSLVRAAALNKLNSLKIEISDEILTKLVNDKSYKVSATALQSFGNKNLDNAINLANDFVKKGEENDNMVAAICKIYADSGKPEFNSYYLNEYSNQNFMGKIRISNLYVDYLANLSDNNMLSQAIDFYTNNAKTEENKWLRYKATESLFLLKSEFLEKNEAIEAKIESGDLVSVSRNDTKNIKDLKAIIEKIDLNIKSIKEQEEDKSVKLYYNFLQ